MRTGTLFKQAAFAPGPNSFEQGANISPMSNVLRRWHEPGCKLALWERSLDADFVRQLDQLPIGALPAARLTVSLETVRETLQIALRASSLGDPALQAAFVEDLCHLFTLFANATRLQEAELRIEPVRGDACRRFHVDVAHARLVTTYIGPGTVWVPPEHGEEAVSRQEDYCGPIYQMPRFAVGLFGGSDSDSGGLVHRSPRLAGSDTFRLFVCVNKPSQDID